MSEWVSEWVSEWMGGWVVEWVSEWVCVRVSEWMNDWVSEWVGGWVNVSEWVSDIGFITVHGHNEGHIAPLYNTGFVWIKQAALFTEANTILLFRGICLYFAFYICISHLRQCALSWCPYNFQIIWQYALEFVFLYINKDPHVWYWDKV